MAKKIFATILLVAFITIFVISTAFAVPVKIPEARPGLTIPTPTPIEIIDPVPEKPIPVKPIPVRPIKPLPVPTKPGVPVYICN